MTETTLTATGAQTAAADPPPAIPADVRCMSAGDLAEFAHLHDRVFGPGAYVRTAYRVREAAPAFSRYCLVSRLKGRMVAAIRFTEILIAGKPGALLLGPLAVAPEEAGKGYGKELVAKGLAGGEAGGVRIVLLVGNRSYYARFGFAPVPPGQITLPGPVDYARLLAAELEPGALAHYRGPVTAVGR